MPCVSTPLPLHNLRVLELSGGYAAGLVGRLLRGYGAHVSRIDHGMTFALTTDEQTYLHQGKHVADLADLGKLLSQADLIVSDSQPHLLTRLGIDWHSQHMAHPEQVIVSVTPFGLTGPYADHQHTNAVAFALGGIMGLTGDATRTPLLTGGNQAYALAGINAFAAAVTAWLGRQRHHHGDVLDISGQECAAGMLEYYGPQASYTGVSTVRMGNHTRATWGVYPCLDGYAGVFALERQVGPLFELLDDPELDHPRFREPLQRLLVANDEELSAKLYVYFADKTQAQLRAISLATRVPIGTATTPRELLTNAGLCERGAFDTVMVDGLVTTVPGRPFPGFGWAASDAPLNDPELIPVGDTVGPPRLPLAGLRVIDLTMMWAGPYATLRMAEMGAEVVKVESPSAWDNIRTLISQPGVDDPWNSSFYFNAYNRDKQSLTLDLAQPAGRNALLSLAAHADVLIENYRADVLDKLDLGVEVLHAANPNLAVVSMAAFGKHGPDRNYVGFGPVIELMSGLGSLSGYGDGEPFKTGISYGDPVAGIFAVAATALALLSAHTGVHVDLAQRETAMVLIGEAFLAAGRGEQPVHRGCRDARFAPQGCYQVAGDDQWLVVSVRTDGEWRALCDVLGLDTESDLRPLDSAQRHVRHHELDAAVTKWSMTQEPQAAMDSLQGVGVPAGRVLDVAAILEDPQLVARGFWVELPHPNMHLYRQQGVVWPMADAQPAPRRHSPLFGEHNTQILQGLLGYTDEELRQLRADAVIADRPINPGVG